MNLRTRYVLDTYETKLFIACMGYEARQEQYPDYGAFQTILTLPVAFTSELTGVVKICNSASGPWMELVIFDCDAELTCSDVCNIAFGKTQVEYGNQVFIVNIVAGKSGLRMSARTRE